MKKVRVIIEVRGGNVQSAYAGEFVEVVVIDHDNSAVKLLPVEPQNLCIPADYRGYDGGFPESWNI